LPSIAGQHGLKRLSGGSEIVQRAHSKLRSRVEVASCRSDVAKNITYAVAISLWLDDRLALQVILDDVACKYVPHIFYCFGGLVLAAFLVQGATGFALTFYYRPSVSDALASVRSIMSPGRASVMVPALVIVLHVCREYLTGGFKKPREVTWVTGITLAVCTVSFGVTGYSQPYDQVDTGRCRVYLAFSD
jgi:quinol-cytochrome oxidoreductase complex cytochrome b subunit